MAQLGEHCLRNVQAVGSIPSISTNKIKGLENFSNPSCFAINCHAANMRHEKNIYSLPATFNLFLMFK